MTIMEVVLKAHNDIEALKEEVATLQRDIESLRRVNDRIVANMEGILEIVQTVKRVQDLQRRL